MKKIVEKGWRKRVEWPILVIEIAISDRQIRLQ